MSSRTIKVSVACYLLYSEELLAHHKRYAHSAFRATIAQFTRCEPRGPAVYAVTEVMVPDMKPLTLPTTIARLAHLAGPGNRSQAPPTSGRRPPRAPSASPCVFSRGASPGGASRSPTRRERRARPAKNRNASSGYRIRSRHGQQCYRRRV